MCVATNNNKQDTNALQQGAENGQVEKSTIDITQDKQETATMHVSSDAFSVSLDNDMSYFDHGASSDAPMAQALSRPVRLDGIDSVAPTDVFTWTVATDNSTKFSPWLKWQENPFIKDKLANFTYMRFNLVVRLVPACTNFQYGTLMINYIPYGESNTCFKTAYDRLRTETALELITCIANIYQLIHLRVIFMRRIITLLK